MVAPSWFGLRPPRAALLLLLLLALNLTFSLTANFEGFDSDDLPSAAGGVDADDEEEGLDDVDLPPPPPISLSTSSPSPPVTSTSAPNPNPATPTPPNPTPALDLWDEDEFEGIPVPEAISSDNSAAPAEAAPSDPSAEAAAEAAPAPKRTPAELLRAFSVEIACVSFLICFVLNYFTGKKQNENIALAWATKFATRDSIFDKNFSLLGTGDGKDTPLLLKEGQDVFKFYASGRRFCQGMLATMEMRARHDLLSKFVELVFPRKDTITFEVVMNEDAMDHVILAVARKKAAKTMQKEERDLQRFANVLTSPPAGRKWVSDELAVVAESKEVAGDIITEAVLDQVLGEKAFEKFGKWFISVKQERDIAVRQVDELRDQNRQIVLEFSINDLEQATEHFSDACKIGETEYGRVYKGIIHKIMVAIKLSSTQSLFRQEVSILREGKHPNIVTIAGVCSEACALVYEWLPNGNLEDKIGYTNDPRPLLWHNRAQIIAEVCSVLLYLHSNKPNAVVHGDLRPCNILLDANYRSKLCNFGTSNPFLEPDACAANLTARLPYLDPEFLTTGELTPLSDVYSLGVIILRLLTGMPPLSIAKKVAAALESDSLHTLIDKTAGDWPYTQSKQLALIALSCVEIRKEKRPDLLTKVWAIVEPMITKPPAASWPYLQSASNQSCVPSHFFCPILMEIMKDPHVASDGFTYEAEAIRRWLDGGSDRSPMTNLALPNRDLVPNHALRSCIQEHLKLQL